MNPRRFQFLSLPALVVALAATSGCKVKYRHEVEAPGTPAQWTTSAGGFMRYDGYDDVAGDLEVGSRDYVLPGTQLRIRLAGAIHIGDIEYYKALQKELLDPADVVLFEGVKFEGDAPPPDLGGLYSNMGQILGIGFQKDGIDYRAKNFVHCDVTVHAGDPLAQQVDPAQMKQAVRMIGMMANLKAMMAPGEQGKETEDALKHQMVSVMAAQMGGDDEGAEKAEDQLRQKAENDEDVPDALKGKIGDLQKALKKLGGGGGDLGDLGKFGGMSPEMKREILTKRNEYVLARLKERIDAADKTKPQMIAVFYGAAHLPGMEQRLISWGFRPTETIWLKAWRINSAGQPVKAQHVPLTDEEVAQIVAKAKAAAAAAPPPEVAEQRPSADAPRARSGKREPTLY